MDRLSMNSKVKQVSPSDSALASDIFDKFCNATTLKTIVGYHRQMCDVLNLRPNHFPSFYPKLRQNVNSWRAKALWKKFDLRASHKCYARGKACPNTRVLIVGAGPCGLRAAIEAQLLGAKVVCVEKRDRMSRNNVLHLWPFVIEDLRALGAKKFFGKFCAGAIDHISIRQLQCILLKVALLLGVEIHTEISFLKLAPPLSKEESQERIGWRGQFSPVEHPVNQYEFDVLIGADGRRNTLEGFRRKEFRGRLAIAITANFINKRTEAEARVEEISGVAFIFNQKFFKDLYEATGIDLENIVYYKDDTHYFVMTAKKQSLLEKGVIINDIADTSKLLGRENVDVDALQNYAREAADFSTQYQMPDLEFAVNHYGNHDVNMFDFTSMYAAENASKVLEKNGHRLLMILVGDSLLEPFWPTGSGCARGFLSSMDACWAIRGWGSGSMTPLEVLSERESIYRLLGQTTPENLQRDSKSYTLDPSTRYPNLNKSCLLPAQVTSLYDTDDPSIISNMITAPPLSINSAQELHKKRRRRDSAIHPDTLLHWIRRQMEQYEDVVVEDLTTSFRDGLILCAVINRYRPDLLDFHALKKEDKAQNNQLAFDILEKELGITPVMTGQEIAENAVPDLLTMMAYLTQIYETFRGEIPHIKHPKLVSNQSFLDMVPEPNFLVIPNVSSDTKKDKSKVPRPINSNSLTAITYERLSRLHSPDNIDSTTDLRATGDFRSKKKLSARDMIKIYTDISSETEKKIENLEKKHSLSDISSKTNIDKEQLSTDSLEVLSPADQYSLTNSSISICSSWSTHNLIDDTDYNVLERHGSDLKTGLYPIPEEDENAYNSDKEQLLSQNTSSISLDERERSIVVAEPHNYFSNFDIPSEMFMGDLKDVSSNTTPDLSEIKKPEQRPIKVKEFNFASKTNICAGPLPGLRKHRRFEPPHIHHGVSASTDATERKTRKRRSMDKVGASVDFIGNILCICRTIKFYFLNTFYITLIVTLFEYIRVKSSLFLSML